MKIELKDLWCIEWEFNREIILDSDKAYTVQAFLGPADTEESEIFNITVCNLDYVRKKEKEDGFFNGLWHLVIENPTKDKLEKYFQDQIMTVSGKTWEECYQKLRLIGQSEFENYDDSANC
jgi:hypothetical protein